LISNETALKSGYIAHLILKFIYSLRIAVEKVFLAAKCYGMQVFYIEITCRATAGPTPCC